MAGSKFFSSLDLYKSFHQLEVAPENCHKTTMITLLGSFEYNKLPMGLRNSPQSFTRFMNKVLRGLPYVFCYVVGIRIFAKTYSDHLAHLTAVFDRLLKIGLVQNQEKCLFAQSKFFKHAKLLQKKSANCWCFNSTIGPHACWIHKKQ